MKKIYLIIISLLLTAITSMLLLSSCNNSKVYKPNREWLFIIVSSNNPVIDTLILKTNDKSWMTTQREIEYVYNRIKTSEGCYSQESEITGVIDRKGNIFSRLFIKPEIWLHPPRSKYLRMTEMLPFPWIKFPIKIGNSINWKLTPKEGWKELKGKSVKGKITVVNKTFYDNPIINDSCWVLEGIGESDIGKFKCKYYFSETYGFVYFLYDFNDYQIEIIPIEIKF